MKVGLYMKGHSELAGRLYAKLLMGGIEAVSMGTSCLCREGEFEGLDAVVAHPEYDNHGNCWDRIVEAVKSYPDVQFYIMAMNATEREDFFGEHDNLTLITLAVQYEFFSNPAEFIGSEATWPSES